MPETVIIGSCVAPESAGAGAAGMIAAGGPLAGEGDVGIVAGEGDVGVATGEGDAGVAPGEGDAGVVVGGG